eukprot:Em0011g736a
MMCYNQYDLKTPKQQSRDQGSGTSNSPKPCIHLCLVQTDVQDLWVLVHVIECPRMQVFMCTPVSPQCECSMCTPVSQNASVHVRTSVPRIKQLCAERCEPEWRARGDAEVAGPARPVLPEDVGKQAALMLIEEIVKGGCADSGSQVIALLFMALGQQDVSKLKLGQLSPYTIQFLRHMRDFLQVTYKIDCQQEEMDDFKTGGHTDMCGCWILKLQ